MRSFSQPINAVQSTVYEEVHIDLAIDMLTSMFDGNDGEFGKKKGIRTAAYLRQASENYISRCSTNCRYPTKWMKINFGSSSISSQAIRS